MNKREIILLLIIIILICILLANSISFAVSISADNFEKNLNAYSNQNKHVSATLKDGSEITVGSSTIFVNIDDTKIKFTEEGESVEIYYSFSDSQCKFYSEETLDKSCTEINDWYENFFLKLLIADFLPTCFLSVTDTQNIDSSIALQYFCDNTYNENYSQRDVLLENLIDNNNNTTIASKEQLEEFILNYKTVIAQNVSTPVLSYYADILSTDKDGVYTQKYELVINTSNLSYISQDDNDNINGITIVNNNVSVINNNNDSTTTNIVLPYTGLFRNFIIFCILLIIFIVSLVLYQTLSMYYKKK